MANFIRPFPIECLGYTSWPLRSSKEIPLFIEDVTERTCSRFVEDIRHKKLYSKSAFNFNLINISNQGYFTDKQSEKLYKVYIFITNITGGSLYHRNYI